MRNGKKKNEDTFAIFFLFFFISLAPNRMYSELETMRNGRALTRNARGADTSMPTINEIINHFGLMKNHTQ